MGVGLGVGVRVAPGDAVVVAVVPGVGLLVGVDADDGCGPAIMRMRLLSVSATKRLPTLSTATPAGK
jgi:hypothetical protein